MGPCPAVLALHSVSTKLQWYDPASAYLRTACLMALRATIQTPTGQLAYCHTNRTGAQTLQLSPSCSGRVHTSPYSRRQQQTSRALQETFGDGLYGLTQQVDGLVEQQLRGTEQDTLAMQPSLDLSLSFACEQACRQRAMLSSLPLGS